MAASREKARLRLEAQEEVRRRSEASQLRVERDELSCEKREKRRRVRRREKTRQDGRELVGEPEAEGRAQYARPFGVPHRTRVIGHPYFPPSQSQDPRPTRRRRPQSLDSGSSTAVDAELETQRCSNLFKAVVKVASRFYADFWSEVCR
jgi:hypothetical protein